MQVRNFFKAFLMAFSVFLLLPCYGQSSTGVLGATGKPLPSRDNNWVMANDTTNVFLVHADTFPSLMKNGSVEPGLVAQYYTRFVAKNGPSTAVIIDGAGSRAPDEKLATIGHDVIATVVTQTPADVQSVSISNMGTKLGETEDFSNELTKLPNLTGISVLNTPLSEKAVQPIFDYAKTNKIHHLGLDVTNENVAAIHDGLSQYDGLMGIQLNFVDPSRLMEKPLSKIIPVLAANKKLQNLAFTSPAKNGVPFNSAMTSELTKAMHSYRLLQNADVSGLRFTDGASAVDLVNILAGKTKRFYGGKAFDTLNVGDRARIITDLGGGIANHLSLSSHVFRPNDVLYKGYVNARQSAYKNHHRSQQLNLSTEPTEVVLNGMIRDGHGALKAGAMTLSTDVTKPGNLLFQPDIGVTKEDRGHVFVGGYSHHVVDHIHVVDQKGLPSQFAPGIGSANVLRVRLGQHNIPNLIMKNTSGADELNRGAFENYMHIHGNLEAFMLDGENSNMSDADLGKIGHAMLSVVASKAPDIAWIGINRLGTQFGSQFPSSLSKFTKLKGLMVLNTSLSPTVTGKIIDLAKRTQLRTLATDLTPGLMSTYTLGLAKYHGFNHVLFNVTKLDGAMSKKFPEFFTAVGKNTHLQTFSVVSNLKGGVALSPLATQQLARTFDGYKRLANVNLAGLRLPNGAATVELAKSLSSRVTNALVAGDAFLNVKGNNNTQIMRYLAAGSMKMLAMNPETLTRRSLKAYMATRDATFDKTKNAQHLLFTSTPTNPFLNDVIEAGHKGLVLGGLAVHTPLKQSVRLKTYPDIATIQNNSGQLSVGTARLIYRGGSPELGRTAPLGKVKNLPSSSTLTREQIIGREGSIRNSGSHHDDWLYPTR